MHIKLCGLKTPEAIDAAIAEGATHLGFIFFEKSPRNVTRELAATLAANARAKAGAPKLVAVTVDAEDGFLDAIVKAVRPDMLQLHGRETPQRLEELKARHGLPVMKAFSISSREDLARIEPYRGVADAFLFDAKPPKGSELPGGNAVSFDWTLLNGLPSGIDWFLSGGIHAGNVGEAMRIANPPGLDLSSGVESSPGVKDVKLIAAFFDAVQTARGD